MVRSATCRAAFQCLSRWRRYRFEAPAGSAPNELDGLPTMLVRRAARLWFSSNPIAVRSAARSSWVIALRGNCKPATARTSQCGKQERSCNVLNSVPGPGWTGHAHLERRQDRGRHVEKQANAQMASRVASAIEPEPHRAPSSRCRCPWRPARTVSSRSDHDDAEKDEGEPASLANLWREERRPPMPIGRRERQEEIDFSIRNQKP